MKAISYLYLRIKKYPHPSPLTPHPGHGFTLIELLVTISIIALLAAVGAVIYSSAIRANRDHIRARHLNDLKIALDSYRADLRHYPATATVVSDLASYVQTIPQDPIAPHQNYVYKALPEGCNNLTPAGFCSSFVYCAFKEGTGTFNNPGACTALDCKTGGVKCNMGVTIE